MSFTLPGSRFSVRVLVRVGLAALACVLGSAPALAATCESLATLQLPNTEITSVASVAPGGFSPPAGRGGGNAAASPFASLPAFCRVAATLRPSSDSDIRIEVWLPAGTWNGKFQAVGNGGWAGAIPFPSLANALARGYATAGTDTGHQGNSAAFALGHPEKVTDMAYRAVHEMTLQAKALIAAFYGDPPKLSLWNSCSQGGRQGITAAVRYPEDFDAVVAGAPAVNWMRMHAGRVAFNQAINRSPAHVIPREKYSLIHGAVLNACDTLDGVRDGVLENPRACTFDPQVLECKGPDAASCLTPAQVEAARAHYAPVRDPATGDVIMPGLERGTELSWNTLGGAEPIGNALEALKYVVFGDPNYDWRRFNLAADLARFDAPEFAPLASTDSNLKPFFDRGGKLLMYHGWSDPQVVPGNTVTFFNKVAETVGRDAIGRSLQLYMVPGMNHCQGGVGTDRFDVVAAVEEWVTTGRAPARIPATRYVNGAVDRTRPLCPYGEVARWDGRGSPDDAASFACVTDVADTRTR